jgi:arginine utilization protein RocB
MAKITDYTFERGDIVNLTDSVDLTDTTTIQILLRVIVDAELGADELIDDLRYYNDSNARDAVKRAKQRANEYGVLRNKLKQLIADS